MVFKPKYDPVCFSRYSGREIVGLPLFRFCYFNDLLWVLVNFVMGVFCDILCCSGIIISRPSSFSSVLNWMIKYQSILIVTSTEPPAGLQHICLVDKSFCRLFRRSRGSVCGLNLCFSPVFHQDSSLNRV